MKNKIHSAKVHGHCEAGSRPEQPEDSDRTAKSLSQESAQHVRDLGYTHPASEDAIWQSEMSLKRASGEQRHEVLCSRHVYFWLHKSHPLEVLEEVY